MQQSHVELQGPEKRNALGVEAYTLLADLLRQVGAMPDARAVVLSGQGEAFCAGNDLAEFAPQWPQPPGGPVVPFLEALRGLAVPVVAAVGALSQDTARLMVFKLVMAAAKTWRRLKGENQLPKVVQGVTFTNGVEVISTPAQRAA